MFFSTLPVVLAALPVAFAQYGNSDASMSSSMMSMSMSSSMMSNPMSMSSSMMSMSMSMTSSAAATVATAASGKTVHVVKVGETGLTFSPNSLNAAVGDVVEFQFYPMAHSVAQSSFQSPCMPLNSSAFFSGPVKSSSGVASTTYQLEINNTAPIWFYCATGKHCESGMTGVINQATTGNKTLQAYTDAAKNVSSTMAPAMIQGGVLATSLLSSTSTNSSSSTNTSSGTSSSSSTKSAGVETRGSVAWMSLSVAGAFALAVGSLMI